jgi:hypothetical protein
MDEDQVNRAYLCKFGYCSELFQDPLKLPEWSKISGRALSSAELKQQWTKDYDKINNLWQRVRLLPESLIFQFLPELKFSSRVIAG